MPKGIVIADSDDVEILDNDMFEITTDNIVFSGLQRALILRNWLAKKALPLASTAHPDHIQGTKAVSLRPSVDVLIADNLLDSPADGKESQGVHLDDDLNYSGIVVRDNVLLNTIYRSLSCIEGAGISFLNNVASTSRVKTAAGSQAYSGLYYKGAGECRGNTVNHVAYGVAADQKVIPLSTTTEIDALRASWLAEFRPVDSPIILPPPVVPAVDPRDAQLVEQAARINRLLTERTTALGLAKQARAARAKNQYLDQLIALLSAPAP